MRWYYLVGPGLRGDARIDQIDTPTLEKAVSDALRGRMRFPDEVRPQDGLAQMQIELQCRAMGLYD